MSVNDRCVRVVAEASGLDDDQVQQIIDHLEKMKGDPDFKAKVLQDADDLAKAASKQAASEKLAMAAKYSFKDYMAKALPAVQSGKANISDVLEGFLAESNKKFPGARDSVYWGARAAAADSQNDLISQISTAIGKRYGMLAQDKPTNRNVALELAGHDSGNSTAKQIADIFRTAYDKTISRLNSAGASIDKLPNYIFAQHHDQYSIAKAGFEKWYGDIQPLLDPKTWGNSDPKGFLHTVYQNILQGSHDNSWQDNDYRNTSGLAARLSRHRVLQFKNGTADDVDNFLKYNDTYGKGSTINNALHQVMNGNAKGSIMERMGPNPEAMFNWALEQAKSASRTDGKLMTPLQEGNAKRQFNVLSGANTRIESATIAHNFAVFRALTNWAHLGMSTISSFGDINQQAMILHYVGMPVFDSYMQSIKTFASFFLHPAGGAALRDPEQMAMLKSLASGMDGINHANAGRWSADGDLSGKMARMTSLYFTMNRQAYWDDVVKFGTSKAIATWVAHNAGQDFNGINASLREQFIRSGIGEAEWKHIGGSEKVTVGGHDHILPDQIQNKAAAAKYQQFLLQNAEVAVPLPGPRLQAYTGALTKGNFGAELVRTMTMFKSFPASIIDKMWPRIQEMGLPGLGMAVAGALPLGYASLALKNVLEGKEPPDPRKLETYLASFLQSGAGSLPADLVTHKFDKNHSLGDLLVGPGGAEMSDLASAFSAPLHEEFQAQPKWAAVRTQAIKTLSNDVPFVNMWATKLFWNQLVVNNLLEASNPGYLDRSRALAAKNYDEKYLTKPTWP